jgi:hypothetical protein
MLMLVVVVLLTVALSHGLVEPLVVVLRPVFNLSWLGWGLVGLLAWLLAGGGPGSSAPPREGANPPSDQG